MVQLAFFIILIELIFIILLLIIFGSQGARNVLDGVFWLVVAGLILIRYIDIKVFHEQSDDNKPATLKEWLRYSVGLILMAGFFWVVALAIVKRIH